MLYHLIKLPIILISIMMLLGAHDGDTKLNVEPQTAQISLHEMTRQIRQYKSWQILQAIQAERTSGYPYFKFKLLRNDGKLIILEVDPRNPNLNKLE